MSDGQAGETAAQSVITVFDALYFAPHDYAKQFADGAILRELNKVRYCCFTAALLLLYCCFTMCFTAKPAGKVLVCLLLYCFTALLPALLRGFSACFTDCCTAALLPALLRVFTAFTDSLLY